MKKNFLARMSMVYLLLCLLASGGFVGLIPAHASGPYTPALPPVITLLEETPLYAEPDDSLEPVTALSPQDVETVEAEEYWYAKAGEKVWIRIKTTWAGNL